MSVANSNLDRYRVVSRLGSGGMATVMLGEDTLLERQVALKRLHTTGDVRAVSRLKREALLGASVSHPNLVGIYDVFTSDEHDLVIVMEYVPGETLREALNRQPRLPTADALRILGGTAAGLDAIHRERIVHRDVKPSNILLGTDGAVKVADLGIASNPEQTRITTTGSMIGSLSYMAPEQLRDGPSSAAIDVYALSAVAFEVLSGRKARPEANAVALAHAISTLPPPDLRDAWPQAPAAAAELLAQGMSRDPAARPASAGELIGRLREALEPEVTAPVARPADVAPPPAAARAPAAAVTPRIVPARAGHVVTEDATDRGRRSPTRLIAAALVALVACAIVLAVVLNAGGSGPGKHARRTKSASRATAASSTTSRSRTTASSATAPSTTVTSSASAPASPAPSAGSPVSTVETFYQLAASHQYAKAWPLADSTLQSQLGGYASFQSGQAGDRSITFDKTSTTSQSSTSATVAVTTTSVRDDGTHHCTGTVDLSRSGAAWLMHMIHITCT